jgi:CHAD domain-containing protein
MWTIRVDTVGHRRPAAAAAIRVTLVPSLEQKCGPPVSDSIQDVTALHQEGTMHTTTSSGSADTRPVHPRHNETLTAGEVVQAALRAQVKHLRAQELGVRQAIPTAVTEMRVTTRQLRSTLRGFSRVLDPQATRPFAEELKWLGAQLGEENDTEAMIKEFDRLLAALPQNLIIGPVETELENELGHLADQGKHTIQAALASDRYLTLQRMLDQLLTDPPLTHRAERPAPTELPKNLAKAVRRLDRRLADADAIAPGPARDEALHEARKADKQVRYMTEILTPINGKPAKRLRRQAKKLQDLLGDYQDAVVARPLLRKLSATAHANGQTAFTYHLLDALEHARTERVLRELPHRLARLHDDRTLSWLLQSRHTQSDRALAGAAV